MIWLAVGLGGALGSMARHAVNHIVHSRWMLTRFPIGTAAINITGCFVIGLLAGFIASERIALRLYWREFVLSDSLAGLRRFRRSGSIPSCWRGPIRWPLPR
jgi:CrcB protein